MIKVLQVIVINESKSYLNSFVIKVGNKKYFELINGFAEIGNGLVIKPRFISN